jgi:hypothetical protein
VIKKGVKMNDIGTEVFWNDPDNEKCSGWRIISGIVNDEVVALTDLDGNCYTEALISELS